MTDYPSSVLPASQYHQADHITVEGKGPLRIWRKCAHKCWSKSQPPNPPKAPSGDNQKKKMISWRMSLEIVTHKHFKSCLKSSPRKAAMNSLSYTYIYGALLSSKMTEGLVKGIGFSFHFPNKIQSVTINILNLCLPSIVRVELLMPRLPRALYKTCGANWATLPLCTIREFLHVKWWSKFLLESSHGITSIINSVPSNLQQLCHLQLPS